MESSSPTRRDGRTRRYFVQLRGTVLFQGAAMAVSFVTLPVILSWVGGERYGVWATLTSVLAWLTFFDFGLGHGTRNRVATALADGSAERAGSYVATSYAIAAAIAALLAAVVALVAWGVDWRAVFNTSTLDRAELSAVVAIAGVAAAVNLCLGLVRPLMHAAQRSGAEAFLRMLNATMLLAAVAACALGMAPSLPWMGSAWAAATLGATLAMSAWFFARRPDLRPRRSRVDWQHARGLMALGGAFFLLQGATLVVHATDRLVVTQLFGAAAVTGYDATAKLLLVVFTCHLLVSTPLWSAYTDAWARGDVAWIRSALWRVGQFTLLVFVALSALTLLTPAIVDVWLGGRVAVDSGLAWSMALFVAISIWANVWAYVINGIGAIRLAVWTSGVAAVLNIPLSVLLARTLGLGIPGVVLGTSASLLPAAILGPLQVRRLLRGTATGIWAR